MNVDVWKQRRIRHASAQARSHHGLDKGIPHVFARRGLPVLESGGHQALDRNVTQFHLHAALSRKNAHLSRNIQAAEIVPVHPCMCVWHACVHCNVHMHACLWLMHVHDRCPVAGVDCAGRKQVHLSPPLKRKLLPALQGGTSPSVSPSTSSTSTAGPRSSRTLCASGS